MQDAVLIAAERLGSRIDCSTLYDEVPPDLTEEPAFSTIEGAPCVKEKLHFVYKNYYQQKGGGDCGCLDEGAGWTCEILHGGRQRHRGVM